MGQQCPIDASGAWLIDSAQQRGWTQTQQYMHPVLSTVYWTGQLHAVCVCVCVCGVINAATAGDDRRQSCSRNDNCHSCCRLMHFHCSNTEELQIHGVIAATYTKL